MGAVSSSCENCFGGKTDSGQSRLNPNSRPKRDKYDELKSDYHVTYQPDFRVSTDAPRSLNTAYSRSPTRLKEKHNKHMSPKSGMGGDYSHGRKSNKPAKVSIEDFVIKKVLGRGAFGKVCLAQKKGERNFLALKTLKKQALIKGGNVEHTLTEKSVLEKAVHPFIVKLHYSFQSSTALYFVMDFCAGGEFLTQLKKKGKFDEECVRFYTAEIILGLQYLHENLNLIYRDLKPENILLDATGHIKITDFGLSKIGDRAQTLCGTPQYMAPEIFQGETYDKTVDWWSLGCLVYEMIVGCPPFNSTGEQLEKEIVNSTPNMPSHFSESATDLLTKLLVKNPKKRLGFNGAEEIKQHSFFKSIDWNDILTMRKKPPIIPMLTRADDLRNFDKGFLLEPIAETPQVDSLGEANGSKNPFQNFSYIPKDLADDKHLTKDSRIAC